MNAACLLMRCITLGSRANGGDADVDDDKDEDEDTSGERL